MLDILSLFLLRYTIDTTLGYYITLPIQPWVILSPSILQVSKFLMIDISPSYPLLANIYICIMHYVGAGAGAGSGTKLDSSIGSGAEAGAEV